MQIRRPMETEMATLYQRIDAASGIIDHLITFLVGAPRGFTLMIHPRDNYYATLSVTNLEENIEAVRGWLKEMDERIAAGKPFDSPDDPQPGNLLTDTAAIKEAIANGGIVHPGALAAAFDGPPTTKRKRAKARSSSVGKT